MLEALQFLAIICATLFCGAALYINIAEHPARMKLRARSAAAQWETSYKRATWMQAPLALVSFGTGVATWTMGGGAGWLVAALLIGAVVPFTFLVIMPTNRRLMALDTDPEETRALLTRWVNLHAARTLLSGCAALVYVALVVWA